MRLAIGILAVTSVLSSCAHSGGTDKESGSSLDEGALRRFNETDTAPASSRSSVTISGGKDLDLSRYGEEGTGPADGSTPPDAPADPGSTFVPEFDAGTSQGITDDVEGREIYTED